MRKRLNPQDGETRCSISIGETHSSLVYEDEEWSFQNLYKYCESASGYAQSSQFQMIARDAEQKVFAAAASGIFGSTKKAVKRTTVGGRRMKAGARTKGRGD